MDYQTQFATDLHSAARMRRAAELLTAEAAATFSKAKALELESRGHRFSIKRSISVMTTQHGRGGLYDGVEAEYAQEAARQAGRMHDPHRPLFPWDVLTRTTLQVGTAASGGYIVDGTGVPLVVDALAPWSVSLRAGCTVLPNLTGNVKVPYESATGTAQWVTELGTGTASELTLGAASLTPKIGVGFMQISGRLLEQGPLAEGLINGSLRRSLGLLFDQAICNGAGTGGQPQGINGASGVTVTTGTGLTLANVLNEQEQVALASVQDGNHAWVGHPTVRELLSARDVGTNTGRFLWDRDQILNRPAFASTVTGVGKVFHGDWSQVVLGLWGPGFQIEHDPYSGFQSNTHGYRIVVNCDVGITNPTAMRVLTGIT